MTPGGESIGKGNGDRWTLVNHESRLKDLEKQLRDARVEVMQERITNLQHEMVALRTSVQTDLEGKAKDIQAVNAKSDRVWRTIIGAAVSVIGGGVLLAIGQQLAQGG